MHPIAFQLGSFTIHWYGVMIALAFFTGLWTATRRARRENIPGEKITDVTLWILAGAMIGARAVYVATYWQEEFAGQPLWQIFAVWQGGIVYYGGLIGAVLAAFIYLRWKKLPLWKTADVLAPSIALGNVFGRIGCFLNGCCFGRVCSLPWAVQFPNQSYAWSMQYQQGLPGVGPNSPSLPVHPTEIYDALDNFILYLLLAWLFRHKKFDGQVFATYLLGYAVTRTIMECFRGDYSALHFHYGLTPGQLVSLPIFIAGLALAIALSRRVEAKRG
ncbi:MAG: prolipoprotein diacylglyceryl transferase [Limisphaerales bacterium]